MQRYEFKVFADYYQFALQDDDINMGDLSHAWTYDAIDNMIALVPHTIGISTIRNMDVAVTIEVHDAEPPLEPKAWDQVTECSICLSTGKLVVLGNDCFPDAPRINMRPDTYRARVQRADSYTSSPSGLDGEENYKIVLWPDIYRDPVVVKKRIARG